MVIAIGFIAGIPLGMRWRYVILFPAMLIAMGMLFSVGGLNWAETAQVVLTTVALQMGYICGVTLRLIGLPHATNRKWQDSIHQRESPR
jgi:hypothetical protein